MKPEWWDTWEPDQARLKCQAFINEGWGGKRARVLQDQEQDYC